MRLRERDRFGRMQDPSISSARLARAYSQQCNASPETSHQTDCPHNKPATRGSPYIRRDALFLTSHKLSMKRLAAQPSQPSCIEAHGVRHSRSFEQFKIINSVLRPSAIIYNGNAYHKPRRREEPNVRHQDAPALLRNSKDHGQVKHRRDEGRTKRENRRAPQSKRKRKT